MKEKKLDKTRMEGRFKKVTKDKNGARNVTVPKRDIFIWNMLSKSLNVPHVQTSQCQKN
jgi:hypothetical protein